MNWDDIQYFLAVAEGGTLSAAARSLCVEHSTVARRIALLEEQLGIRLFDRMARGWQLTEEGKDLLPCAQEIQENTQRIRRIADRSASLSGSVRLSAPPLVAYHLLAPLIPKLRHSLPNVEIELLSELQDANLHRREADIALRMRRPKQLDLVAKLITTIPYALYAHHDYLEHHTADQWQFVGYEKSMQSAPQQQWLDEQLNGREMIFRSNDLHVLAKAIEQNIGVGVLPCFLEASYPQLKQLSTPACPISRDLWLVIHPDLRRSPRVRAVADELIRWFEATL